MSRQTYQGNLADIASYTALMRHKAKEMAAVTDKRRDAVKRHKDNGATYAELAEAMGITDVAVYKILRGKQGPLREQKRSST